MGFDSHPSLLGKEEPVVTLGESMNWGSSVKCGKQYGGFSD